MDCQIVNDIDAIIHFYEENNLLKQSDLLDNDYFKKIAKHLLECILTLPEYGVLADYRHIELIIDKYLVIYSCQVISYYGVSQLNYLVSKIRYLEKIPQPEQRTDEWYIFRNNRLTASDLFYVIDEYDKKMSKKNYKPTRKYNDMICKKCGVDMPFIRGDAINHGIKFEPIATLIYENRNDIEIIEFGCLPHPHIPFFGASPDGIVGYNSNNKRLVGRMLEIKCPKSRPITGVIPDTYYAQMQGQLEVCDLRYCDYLECDFKFYKSEDDFFDDIKENQENSIDSDKDIDYVKNNKNNECGSIVEFYNTDTQKFMYHYTKRYMLLDREKFKKWEGDLIQSIFTDDNKSLEYVGTRFWYLNKFNVILVERDREWFNNNYIKIESFWSDVLKYREIGTSTIVKKKKYEYKDNTLELKFME
jgi:putative phage-type endonuclease